MAKTAKNEVHQIVADAHIDLAQHLERIAQSLRNDAKAYRRLELMPGYVFTAELLPTVAAPLLHPAARAIESLRNVRYMVERESVRNADQVELTASVNAWLASKK